MVGIVQQTGSGVHNVVPGDRVAVNVETFCGECFFCRHGYVNNCSDPLGGWALGCRIDGGQAEYVRVPYADQGLTKIPDSVTDEQALFVGDILATGFWASKISDISEEDTVLIIGAGPTGVCTLLCAMLKSPERIIVCEKSPERRRFIERMYPQVLVTGPEHCREFVLSHSRHGGADRVIEVAGTDGTFRMAWECARPNAIVTIVAMYDRPQILPQEPDFQDRGSGRLRLCQDSRPYSGGKDRYHTPYHPQIPSQPYCRGLQPFRKPPGRSD